MKRFTLIVFTSLLVIHQSKAQLQVFTDQLVSPHTWPYFYWPAFDFLYNINGVMEVETLTNNVWTKDDKYIFTKDAQGQFTNFKIYDWNPTTNSWDAEVDYEASTTYNSQGQLVYLKYWSNMDEMNEIVWREFSYNANGQYSTVTGSDSAYFNGMWIVYPFTDNFVYDANGRITERTISPIDPTIFAFNYKISLSYDGSGYLSQAHYQTGFLGMWNDWLKFDYTHYNDGKVKSIHHYEFEDNTTQYELSHIDSLYYPASNIIVHIAYDQDDNGNVVPDSKGYYYYDAQGNLQHVVAYNYNNGWVKYDSTRYIYAKGMPTSSFAYLWQGIGYAADPYQKGTFNNYITGIGPEVYTNNKSFEVKILPNPVDDIAVLRGPDFSRVWSASVYQSDGKLVLSTQLSHPQLNVEDINPGLYFVKLSDGKVVYTGKMIKK